MPVLKNIDTLMRLREQTIQNLGVRIGNAVQPEFKTDVVICGGTGCHSANSQEVFQAIQSQITQQGLDKNARVVLTGCRGLCAMGPVMQIFPQGIFYSQVKASDAPTVVEQTIANGNIVEKLCIHDPAQKIHLPYYQDIPFYNRQVRIALRNCGLIDPKNIEEYIAQDGYRGLAKALTELTPDEVIETVKDSGLRGRGGAGFLTGAKWEFCRRANGSPKYVICNADEGDPGAFMDRSILEGDPHAVLEGMIIAGYAIGAREGYIYCRAEYPLAIAHLKTALAQAHEYGLLGENILGSGFSFDLHVYEGAGAFVCGEETALMASIEGKRGEPRPRPPFPAISGLWNKPSNVNNVKSYALTPRIILNGAKWFAGIGTKKSFGTAIFALTGKVNNTGLIEVPMGIPLGEIIFDVGGGIPDGKPFKAVQTGGPLGGCLPASALNTPVDFDALVEAGATMGSGGMIVVDDETCMVEFAKYFLTFASAESCGKCIPCRIGGTRMLEILTRITEGKGVPEDVELIEEISRNMREASLCALGQLTPGPVMASLRFFKEEFIAHVEDKYCVAGQCKPLVRAKCINACPAGVDSPAYIALVAQGRYTEGLEIHRQRNPFALICGRVCPAFCEQKCRRGEIDEPIAIRMIKRFMADQEYEQAWTPKLVVSEENRRAADGKKVAVVGAGPAGLTTALRLAQRGYSVTVLEKLPIPGGMMTVGIPAYRLPREPLFAEIDNIKRAGVEVRYNQTLGKDFNVNDLFNRDGFNAVVLALGAHKSRKLGIAGEEKHGVIHGTDFLRDIALEQSSVSVKGKRVAVIGGGDVAIDAARSAWRLGASSVDVIYRRQRADMPAHLEEIESAIRENTQFHFLANPVRVLGEEHVSGVAVQRQRLAEFDSSGRRKPVPAENDEFTLEIDVLIPAIGQMTDLDWMNGEDIETTKANTFAVKASFNTTWPGVFAAGDAVSGPATVVQAVAHGNLVAVAVDHWLQTGEMTKPHYETPRPDIEQPYNLDDYANAQRPEIPEIKVIERVGNFKEVETGFDEQTAQEEAKRCLRCDLEWLDLMKIPRPQ